ncbi:MFS family permease [Actinomadura coerulea]|uniref:MFS family permease n=1 Tax=Actinomadura coerulea TaxID=46159 RepID=A0A7X0G8A3_9ACTN|nr:MFS transporter [Actinomadura coerulea]MBB6400136.1 MFS family permease [Actinomadura coerulea]
MHAKPAATPKGGGILRQPTSVWATAFAAVVAFMGIGLVDPILPAIAKNLDASPSQVSLLFTSYFLITAVAMLVTGWVSSRIGGKRTLLIGLALVVAFAALAGTSGTVGQLIGFRAGWGLGNALFVATALAVIVGSASGGAGGDPGGVGGRPPSKGKGGAGGDPGGVGGRPPSKGKGGAGGDPGGVGGRPPSKGKHGAESAIILYEAALGIGISLGPLAGALLGDMNWRFPFFGTAALMAVGFLLITTLLRPTPKPAEKTRLSAPIRALAHGGLSTTAFTALFYNYAFFTVLAFTPFVLGMSAHGIGLVFFGWGVMVALASVFGAPVLQRRVGTVRVMYLALALLIVFQLGLAFLGHGGIVACTVLSGIPIGLNNTAFTEAAMEVSDSPRPVASAGYNFVRWMGGALAPYIATKLAEEVDASLPYLVGAACCAVAIGILVVRRRHLAPLERVDIDPAFQDAPAVA